MAIEAGSLIAVTVGGTMFENSWMNVWTFRVEGEVGSPSAANIAEAIWNGFKTPYRALVANIHTSAFQYVKIREMDSLTGEYGEFPIPSGEAAGTGGTSATTYLSTFTAAGIRFTVGSRVTRPGQKRIPGQRAEDQNSFVWTAADLAKLNTFGTAALANAILGAPAAGTEVSLVVVSVDRTTGLPVANQDVTGFIVNQSPTSQVSRKAGVGA